MLGMFIRNAKLSFYWRYAMSKVEIDRNANGRETITVTVKSGFAIRIVVTGNYIFLHGGKPDEQITISQGDQAFTDTTFGVYPKA